MIGKETDSVNGKSITIDDLCKFDFERVLSRQGKSSDEIAANTCEDYSKNFIEEAKLAADNGDEKRVTICELFGTLTSIRFQFNDTINDGFPSPRIMDEHVELLKEYVHKLLDSELRARVADFLWKQRGDKSFQFAELAVDAYFDSATIFNIHTLSYERTRRIERGFQIAASLGRNGHKYQHAVKFIEEQIQIMKDADILTGPPHLMRLLQEQHEGDPGHYASYAIHLADSFESIDDWEGARSLWRIAERWHELAKDAEAAHTARLRSAQTYEPEAKYLLALEKPNFFKVIHTLQCGIEALKRAKAQKNKIDRVHTLLLECQEKNDDFKQFSHSVDITGIVNSYRESFSGLSPKDVLLQLAIEISSPSYESLKQEAEKHHRDFPIQFFGTRVRMDSRGRTVGKSHDFSIQNTMYSNAILYQNLIAQSLIAPVIQQLNQEHCVSLDDFFDIVKNNPFIPTGRQRVFIWGLYHGCMLDFMLASHLLIPQLENSIRYVLGQYNVITTSINQDGIQEQFSLHQLLYNVPEVTKIFGDDLVFDLQGLFLERFGSNLRNLLTHGLLNDDRFLSGPIVYAWGTIVRMICMPILGKRVRDSNDNG